MMRKYEYGSYIETEYMRKCTENMVKKELPRWKKYMEENDGFAILWLLKDAKGISVRHAEILLNREGLIFKPEKISDDGSLLKVRIYKNDGCGMTKDEYEDRIRLFDFRLYSNL